MAHCRRIPLPCVSLVALLLAVGQARAQSLLPDSGRQARFAAYIEMPKAYLSGICLLRGEGTEVRGALFNEFGISAATFTYRPGKRRVRLHEVMAMLDKWYIRRTLSRDLATLMNNLGRGNTSHENSQRHISYQLTPMNTPE